MRAAATATTGDSAPPAYGDAPRGDENPADDRTPADHAGSGEASPGAPHGDETPPPPPPWFGAGPSGGAASFSRTGLVRPEQGRYLAGVCAAIGRATNTDPVLWRVVLAVLGLLGVGVLLYLIGWLLIPAEGDTASPVEALLGRGRSQTSPLAVLILAGMAAVSFAFMVSRGFSGTLLGGAVLVGGLLLLKRNNLLGDGTGAAPAAPAGAPEPAAAAATSPPPAAPAAPYAPAPHAAAHPAGGSAATGPAATARPVTAPLPPLIPPPADAFAPPAPPPPPPPPSGYRPPFAPHGPYAGPQPAWRTAPPPPPKPAKPPTPPRVTSKLGRITFFLVLVAIGLVALLDVAGVDVQTSTYFAAALVTLALGLVVGAWVGRARGLIFLALIASIGLGVSSATEHWGVAGLADPVTWQPRTIAGIADRYETPVGDATLDLRNVDFAGQNQETSIVMHAGRLRVLLPPTVDTTAQVDVGFGSAKVFGQDAEGPDLPTQRVTDEGTDGPGGGALRLAITVDAGDVEVTR
jgi:phage shock protein PspC (stress-responsive transcriptional regulator)